MYRGSATCSNTPCPRRHALLAKDLPAVNSPTLFSSQGVASLPRLLTPLASASCMACSTARWSSSPTDSYCSGMGTAKIAPCEIPSCWWVSAPNQHAHGYRHRRPTKYLSGSNRVIYAPRAFESTTPSVESREIIRWSIGHNRHTQSFLLS